MTKAAFGGGAISETTADATFLPEARWQEREGDFWLVTAYPFD
jgi:hypothetical protein